jgi:predicted  nucleic acid-binding Zn-ribbon protein
MPATGEKPGKGDYKCTNCGNVLHLENDDDALPPCPKCGNKTFDKV